VQANTNQETNENVNFGYTGMLHLCVRPTTVHQLRWLSRAVDDWARLPGSVGTFVFATASRRAHPGSPRPSLGG
jgi:hypothetical protein